MKRLSHLRGIIGALLSSLLVAVCSPVACFSGEAPHHARPEAVVSGGSITSLKRKIDAIVNRELLPATNAAIKVISLAKGDILYEYNPRLLLVPASTQKLFTAAAALSILGPDREVATTVMLDNTAGTIYLKGGGDALLSQSDLSAMAAATAKAQDGGREYALAADVSCFDDLYRGKGWMWDDDEFLISPLSVDHNAVSVLIKPGPRAGAAALVTTEPHTSYYSVENLATTGPGNVRESINTARRPGDRDNVVVVTGTIPLGSGPLVKHASVWRPELMALAMFRDALRARGVKISGMKTAAAPAGATVVAQRSRRVEELVRFALKESDNVTAESLLKLMALETTGKPGTAEEGSAAVRSFLEREGIAAGKVVVADGSGLSRYNLTTAETMAETLRAMSRDGKLCRIFRDSLPIAGRDGTLKNRMKGSRAEGNLHGKTGNMTGASSLAGYAVTADGEPFVFAVIIENYAGSGVHAREVQDRIAALLCAFRR